MLTLAFGLFYLGQYQKNLISTKLETFQAEAKLLAAALSEGATDEESGQLLTHKGSMMIRRLSDTMDRNILLFNKGGDLIVDSATLPLENQRVQSAKPAYGKDELYSIRILKGMARPLLKLLPDRQILPSYPNIKNNRAQSYPDVPEALAGNVKLSAWNNAQDHIFLSAAAPLEKNGTILGAVFLTREAKDIEENIAKGWLDVLKVFAGTLIVTILLSIYLSGLIARPLRRLSRAAESVRRGTSKEAQIPDLSHRHDEIGELSLVLRAMTQALWDRMDAVENFAADVAHELKNPLTSLRSAAETASIVKKPRDREKLMAIIRHDIERLDRLISDISNASRLDAALSREEFERVSLCDTLRGLIDIYKDPLEREETQNGSSDYETVTKDGIRIYLNNKSSGTVYVWGIEERLIQIFQNILANALSFSPPGGSIHIAVRVEGRHAHITVEDEGPGIPEESLDTVFERFYSQRPAHEDYGHHSGLGLSLCRQIVTALSGEIFAENARDENGIICGARFTVVLRAA